MDNRITKKRMSIMLSYDWMKLLLIIVGVIVFWSLAYTVGAPRASVGQTFGLFVYGDFQSAEEPIDVLQNAKRKNAFSYDVLDFECRTLVSDYYSTIMTASISVCECDVMITTDYAADIESNSSSMRQLVDSYYSVLYDYDRLIADAKAYCLTEGLVVAGDAGEYVLDENRIELFFAERMEKDPRFRDEKSERYRQGIIDEIARVKKLWNDACRLEQCLVAHPEIAVRYKPYTQAIATAENDDSKKKYEEEAASLTEKIYGIDFGKLTGGEKNITDLYRHALTDGDGKIIEHNADGIVVTVFDFRQKQPDLQYETLGFVSYFIEQYSNFFSDPFTGLIA